LQYEQNAVDYNAIGSAELNKMELLENYKQRCQLLGVAPNRCFIRYLEETADDNESLELVI
jgi:hypothetical protein